jgi:hypothetical protein
MTPIEEVAAERKRQVEGEGWDARHDSQHVNGELALAASCYATGNHDWWPWDWKWWKPGDRRRNLVKAAALIVAEIERLDRQSSAKAA